MLGPRARARADRAYAEWVEAGRPTLAEFAERSGYGLPLLKSWSRAAGWMSSVEPAQPVVEPSSEEPDPPEPVVELLPERRPTGAYRPPPQYPGSIVPGEPIESMIRKSLEEAALAQIRVLYDEAASVALKQRASKCLLELGGFTPFRKRDAPEARRDGDVEVYEALKRLTPEQVEAIREILRSSR
jgi:hypothetical protein